MKGKQTSCVLSHWYDFRLKIFAEGIIIGALAGIVTVAYRLLLLHADELRGKIYHGLLTKSPFITLAWFALLIVVGIILGALVQRIPMIKGSGIPQVKGFLLRQLEMDWLKELIFKFVGGVIAIGFGLSLGREGPSVQLGANVGLGLSRLLKRFRLEEKYLVTAGASAGLAAAFNAPLAGVIFALEELHKGFSPLVLSCAMAASLMAAFVSHHFFGLKPVFDFENLQVLPLNKYGYILVLGILAGIMGKLFNASLLWVEEKFGRSKQIKDIYKPVVPLLLSGILGFLLPAVLGGGHELILDLSREEIYLSFLLILLVVKFMFTVISYGSGVPGGIFLPLLVLGALLGKGYGQFIAQYLGVSGQYVMDFVILAMAAHFTAVVRAPITGSILITEMTGSFYHLLPLVTVSMVAYVVTEILESRAIYEELLENMLKSRRSNWLKGSGNNKVVLEIPVSIGSKLEHQLVKNVKWPKDCLVVGIRRGEKEIIPNGKTEIYAGDCLIVLADEDRASLLKPTLLAMGEDEWGKSLSESRKARLPMGLEHRDPKAL